MRTDPPTPLEDDPDYMLGQCAGCFTMKNIQMGETRCDTCRSIGSHGFEPEPNLRKSGPNSIPEE